MTKHIRILEIGAGPKPKAQILYPEKVFTDGGYTVSYETMDADEQYNPTFLMDATNIPEELHGQFNVVIASHVLEHFSWQVTQTVFNGWAKMLMPGGEIHVYVPSWEWEAWQVVRGKENLGVMAHSCAGNTTPWDIHMAKFTMRYLRSIFERARLAVTVARTIPYSIMAQGDVHEAQEHYIVGKKGNDIHAK